MRKFKLTRSTIDELAAAMPVIRKEEQRHYIAGGDGSAELPFTMDEFEALLNTGTWSGGFVENMGYTTAEVTVTPSGNYSGSVTGSVNSNSNNNAPNFFQSMGIESHWWGHEETYQFDAAGAIEYYQGLSSQSGAFTIAGIPAALLPTPANLIIPTLLALESANLSLNTGSILEAAQRGSVTIKRTTMYTGDDITVVYSVYDCNGKYCGCFGGH